MPKVLRLVTSVALTIGILAAAGCATNHEEIPTNTGSQPTSSAAEPSQTATPPAVTPSAEPTEKAFDKTAKSIDDPASYWVVSNKLRPLDPVDYAADDLVSVPVAYANPPVLRRMASDAVVDMFAAFESETGLQMQSQSAYRSYSAQVRVYNDWVNQLGQEAADLTSARPGFSEHQTGLAIDISAKPAECTLAACFGDTEQGKWLAKNAWEYGFVLRYPEGMTSTTGYEYEPWHYRYVGKTLSTEMHDTKTKTLEEFFGLPKAPDYK